MSREFEVQGLDNLVRVMIQGGKKAPMMLGRALYEEASEIFHKSQNIVPIDTGVLRSSGQVHPPHYSSQEIVVEITYGGAAKDYALIQHENESYKHASGKQARYLSDPVEDAIPSLDRNLADRIEAARRPSP
jgi:hypothetical protein